MNISLEHGSSEENRHPEKWALKFEMSSFHDNRFLWNRKTIQTSLIEFRHKSLIQLHKTN
jgi:hypothetical protein